MTTYSRIKAFDHVYYINDSIINKATSAFGGRPDHLYYLRLADVAVHLPTNTLVKCRYQLVDLLDTYLINNTMPQPMDGDRPSNPVVAGSNPAWGATQGTP